MRRRTAYIPEQKLPGVTTLVTDKSKHGLPTFMDRERETNLPPGSATPNSPRQEDTADGNGRHLGSPSYNVPDGSLGVADRPRSLPTPGEHEGVPTKYDYNYLTRRSIQADDREAYTPRKPWRRQRKQPIWKRFDDKRDYRMDKAHVRQRMKLWYKKVRRDRRYVTLKQKRRERPEKYERRKMSHRVADRYLTAIGEIIMYDQQSPDTRWDRPDLSDRPYKQDGPGQTRHDPGAETHRPNPNAVVPTESGVNAPASSGKVIPESMKYGGKAEAMSEAEYERLIGAAKSYPTWARGLVRLWGGLLYQVYHHIPRGKGSQKEIDEFLRLLVKYERNSSEREDIEDWITDGRGCPSQGVLTCSRKVIEACLTTIANMTPTQAPLLIHRTGRENNGEFASYTVLQGGYGIDAYSQTKTENTYIIPPGYPVIVGHGLADDWEVILKLNLSKVKKIDRKNEGGQDKKAASIADIEDHVATDLAQRAKSVRVSLKRADPENGIWTFRASGSEGRVYTIRVKAERQGNTKEVGKLQVKLSCDCDFFRFQGGEYHAKKDGFLYGKPNGTAARPLEKDPNGKNLCCKHILACLAIARNYRVATEGAWWPAGAEAVLEFCEPSAFRVAARYGGA